MRPLPAASHHPCTPRRGNWRAARAAARALCDTARRSWRAAQASMMSASHVQLAEQPRLGETPVPPNRCYRHVENVCRLLVTEAAEEAQLHNAPLSNVEPGQRLQRIVERDEIGWTFHRGILRIGQRDLQRVPAAALLARVCARDVDED